MTLNIADNAPAIPPFISQAPNPYILPSFIVASNGFVSHTFTFSPFSDGIVSICPLKIIVGPSTSNLYVATILGLSFEYSYVFTSKLYLYSRLIK